jgi:hypothetical protein
MRTTTRVTAFAGGALTTSSAGAPQDPPAAASTGVRPAGPATAGGSDARVRPTGGAMGEQPSATSGSDLAGLG